MVATTTFQGGGYPGRPYGSFAGKSPSAGNGPHDPGRITELWGWGGPGGRHTFVAKAPVTPTPPPPPVTPTGGWRYDPYRRRQRRVDDDEPIPPVAPVVPQDLGIPDRSAEIAALDAQISKLETQIGEARRGRVRLRAKLAALESERRMLDALERHRQMLIADDEWFLLS